MKAVDRVFQVGDRVMVRKDLQQIPSIVSRHHMVMVGRIMTVRLLYQGKYYMHETNGEWSDPSWRNIDLVLVDDITN